MSDHRISRRAYLSMLGGSSLFAILGTGTAFSQYKDWKNRSINLDEMKIIGHRGANGLAPQNTREGIRKAAEYNVDGVELDVQQSSDGELVLFHDPVYDIATDNGTGFVEDTPYTEAKHFHKNGHHVITLSDALEILVEENLELYLEIKSENIYEECMSVLESYNWVDNTTFISLEKPYLKQFVESNRTALINSTPYEDGVNEASALGCDGVATHYTPIEQASFIKEANDTGLESIIWSLVDVEPSIRDSMQTNADVLIANRPDIIQKIAEEQD